MIQQARSSNSQSLLREAETAEYFLDEKDSFFKRAIKKMVENRANPDKRRTGAKEVRDNLLAYLERFGEVKTANIWVRSLLVNQIDELKNRIQQTLANQDIKGVIEIHLSDRQINSPHIQYVGTKAEVVEQLLASLAVEMNFEVSLSSALGRNEMPAYQRYEKKIDNRQIDEEYEDEEITDYEKKKSPYALRVIRTDEEYRLYNETKQITDTVDFKNIIEEIDSNFNKCLDRIKSSREAFLNMFNKAIKRDRKVEIKKDISQNIETILKNWKPNYSLRRRRR